MEMQATEEQAETLIIEWANSANKIGFNPASGLYAACHLAAGFINAIGGKDDDKIDDLIELAVKTMCNAIDDPMFKAIMKELN